MKKATALSMLVWNPETLFLAVNVAAKWESGFAFEKEREALRRETSLRRPHLLLFVIAIRHVTYGSLSFSSLLNKVLPVMK